MSHKDIQHYLNVTEQDNLSYELLNNIDKAAQILISNLAKPNFRAYIQIDADADGYTSAALLLNYINEVFPSAIHRFSYGFHATKAHGINISLIPENTTLVIAPDSSSNEFDIHKELKEQGIDVIVLDHHQAERFSDHACVVNNQLCDYPTKSLSGVGIVYKFCQYLDAVLGQVGFVDKFLDIVAVGLIADMVDVRDFETHYLIQQGLSNFRNPFIKGMAEKNSYSLGSIPSPIGVAFYIVPLINAITRVGTLAEKALLFESMLEYKALEMIPSTKRGCAGQQETRLAQRLRTCSNVKNRQTRAQEEATEQIKQVIKNENLLDNKLLIVKLNKISFDRGIVGLIANQLMAEYQRPTALLVATEIDGELCWSGSARGYSRSNTIPDFRQFCEDSGFALFASGHQNAFGLCIPDSKINDFIKYSNEIIKEEFSPSYKVDYIYKTNTLRPLDILTIGEYKNLWGQNLEEPMFAVEHIQVTRDMVTLMSPDKHPTLKIQLPGGISCIKFRSSQEEYETLTCESSGAVTINLIGRPEINKYLDSITPQLIIVDYEIIGRQKYYF